MAQVEVEYHTTFGKEEGLEIEKIEAMEYDNDGFLWLAGNSSDSRVIISETPKLLIQRFNGRTFHTFTLPAYTINARNVEQLYKLKNGTFLLRLIEFNTNRLLLFNPYTTEFSPVELPNNKESADAVSNVFKIEENEHILIQEGKQISLFEIKENLQFIHKVSFTIPVDKKYLINGRTRLIPFENHFIFSDDDVSMYALGWDGKILSKTKHTQTSKRFWIDELFKVGDAYYFYSINNPKLYKLDKKDFDASLVENQEWEFNNDHLEIFQKNAKEQLLISNKGNDLIFGAFSEEGIEKNKLENFFKTPTPIKAISENLTEEVWLGTGNNKLHYFKFSEKNIQSYLSGKSIRYIKKETDTSYIVTTENSGWFRFTPSSKKTEPILINASLDVSAGSSRNILEDGSKYWTNETKRGMISIDKMTWNVDFYKHYPIVCLEALNDSIVVYGTNGYNLMSFNKNSKKHTKLLNTDSLFIYDIAIKDDLLIGATDKGILKYNINSSKGEFYNDPKLLQSDTYFLMADHIEGTGFVVGSRGGNIINVTNENTFIKLYDDPFNAGIATILPTENSWWINTFNGFVNYNLDTRNSTRYGVVDGFSHNEANRYSALQDEKKLLVGTISGLNYFEPASLEKSKVDAQLKLLSRTSYNKETKKIEAIYNSFNLNIDTPIILPTEHKELSLDFALNNMVREDEHTFYYRLNKSNWISLKKQQTIRFPNLAPGKYMLEIEARDFSNKSIGKPLLLAIDSKDFFYKRWWFIIGVSVAVFLLLIYFLWQERSKYFMQQEFARSLLLSQEAERERIGKELHDSVGQQLTMIKRKSQDENQLLISQMSNQALEEVRSISRNLFPVLLKQLGFSECIEQFIYDLDDKTELFISAEIANVDNLFSENEKLNLYRFVQEAFSNIIKHANATVASIEIYKTEDEIFIKIADNGLGFNVEDKLKYNTLGMKTLVERIKIVHGKLTITSQPNKGTILVAQIPR